MSDTHWWFPDLAAVIAITGALTFAVFSGVNGVARIVLTIPLVLFLPGYAFVSTLFPDKPTDDYQPFDEEKTGLGNPLLATGGLEAIERAVLSVVFSVMLVPTVALLASATPRGLTAETILSGLALLTGVLTLAAIIARYRCPPDRRFTPSLSASPFFTRIRPDAYETRNPRPYNVAIVIGLVLLAASAGLAVVNPPQHDGFTEFSVETENVTGETDAMYEASYTAGESHDLEVSITNREHEERTYTTVAMLERVSYENDSVTVHGSSELDRGSVTVADGETRRQTLEIAPSAQDSEVRLALLLYEGEAPAEPTADDAYRTIHLPIEVE